MSIKSIDEILNAVKERIGDDTSDSAISFVEDISDTLNSLSEQENWKQKYEQNDSEWRKNTEIDSCLAKVRMTMMTAAMKMSR